MRELTPRELDEVSGAVNASTVSAGASLIALGVGIAVAGGLALVPVGILVGAGTLGELLLAGSAVSLSAGGGYLAGTGLCY